MIANCEKYWGEVANQNRSDSQSYAFQAVQLRDAFMKILDTAAATTASGTTTSAKAAIGNARQPLVFSYHGCAATRSCYELESMRAEGASTGLGVSVESSSSASSASLGSACASGDVHQLPSLHRIGASLRDCVGASAGGGGSDAIVSGVSKLQLSVEDERVRACMLRESVELF